MKGMALGLALLAATTGAAAARLSCRSEVGAATAQTLVEQCLAVSPATHPPCNAENPCALIIDEIVRGCRMDADMPGGQGVKFCESYLRSPPKVAPSPDK